MRNRPTCVQRTGTTWTATINNRGYPTSFTNTIHAVGDDGRTYCDRDPDIDPSDDVVYPEPQLSRGDNHLCVDCAEGRPAA